MHLRVVRLDRLVEWTEAHARTGLVLVQPHIELELGRAGYSLKPHLITEQLQTLRSALELGQKSFSPEVPHSHFVILPEYALPSGRFEECETMVLELLPPNGVCIAGFDAMRPERWLELLAGAEGTEEQIAHAQLVQHDWVNGAAIWVKDREGRLHRFLQAKIRPNPQEQRAGTMYRGAEVLYMVAGARTFCILLCYDFIATLDEGDVPTWLWRQVQLEQQHPAPAYLFVLQENERPEHTDFIDSARILLGNPGPRFDAVLFVNGAGRSGRTCLFCSKGDWPPTKPETPLDDIPRVFRREGVGDSELTRIAFRTGAPSVHRFTYVPKSSLQRRAGEVREPIDSALLHQLHRGQLCREGISLHASQHMVAEALSQAGPLASRPQPLTQCPVLLGRLKEACQTVAEEIRSLPPGRLHAILESLLHGIGRTNPDYWEDYPELRSIRRMMEALYVLRAGGIRTGLSRTVHSHITADCDDFTVTILAGDADTCPEYLYGGFLDRSYDVRPHLFLLLEHMESVEGKKAVRIDSQQARRMGAGGALRSFSFDDGPFGRQPDEERLDAPHFYWYDRRALLKVLRDAHDTSAFLRMLMEVFPWRAT